MMEDAIRLFALAESKIAQAMTLIPQLEVAKADAVSDVNVKLEAAQVQRVAYENASRLVADAQEALNAADRIVSEARDSVSAFERAKELADDAQGYLEAARGHERANDEEMRAKSVARAIEKIDQAKAILEPPVSTPPVVTGT